MPTSAIEGSAYCPSFHKNGAGSHGAIHTNTIYNNQSNISNNTSKKDSDLRPHPIPVRLVDDADVAFLFASMTWNVDLLEVLLAKATNPLHSCNPREDVHPEEREVTTQQANEPKPESVDPMRPHNGAAFPSLEEILHRTSTPSTGHKSVPKRSKRRKIARSRGTELPVPYFAYYKEPNFECNDNDNDDNNSTLLVTEQGEEREPSMHTTPITTDIGVYLTEEEEEMDAYSRTGHPPHRSCRTQEVLLPSNANNFEAEAQRNAVAEAAAAARVVELGKGTNGAAVTQDRDREKMGEETHPNREENGKGKSAEEVEGEGKKIIKQEVTSVKNGASMRDFLRIFYQSFVLVMAAQVRLQQQQQQQQQQQTQEYDGQRKLGDTGSRSLSSLEYRALCLVRRYITELKVILRRHVMCGATESLRRGAQPLFVDTFSHLNLQNGTEQDWQPPHTQVYIAGKEPVHQPLLLDTFSITRVVQCYPDSGGKTDSLALSILHCWQRLLLETMPSFPLPGTTPAFAEKEAKPKEESLQEVLFQTPTEWETARALLRRCFSPLEWSVCAPFGPYRLHRASLPLTQRVIAKLTLPAVDDAGYDLSIHFQEGVFRFLHGTPLFPFDAAPSLGSGAALVHCFAGMHRSSGVAIAYLLWLAFTSNGAMPTSREKEASGASYLCAVMGKRQAQTQPSTGMEMVNDARVLAAESFALKGSHGVLQRCVQHVQKQRPMAVPIETVQQQLQRYAKHLQME